MKIKIQKKDEQVKMSSRAKLLIAQRFLKLMKKSNEKASSQKDIEKANLLLNKI